MKSKIDILERFRAEDDRVFCKICSVEIEKNYGKIRISTTDTSHCYKGTKRPFRNNYNLLCCPSCFKHMIDGIENAIRGKYDNNKKNKT